MNIFIYICFFLGVWGLAYVFIEIFKGNVSLNRSFKSYILSLKNKMLNPYFQLFILALGMGLIVFIIVHSLFKNQIVALVLSVVTIYMGYQWFKNKYKAYVEKEFKEGLLSGLEVMSQSLKSGQPVFQSFSHMQRFGTKPFKDEIKICCRNYEHGQSFTQILMGLRQRVPLPDTKIAVGAILIANKYGGNLAPLLVRITATMRRSQKTLAKLQSLTAQGRTQLLFLGMAPPMLFVLMMFIEEEKMSLMLSTGMGQILLVVALVLQVSGIYVTRKMLSFDI